MTELSLTATIYRYRAEMFTQLANQREAEERGTDTEFPVTYWPLIEKIEKWDRPAVDLCEAIDALKLAIEDYEAGDTPRIPAMMKAALGWLDAEYKRRTSL
ncbi:hypothetical protein [Shinella zoogloeoides]|uniref:hypothetical protein n=1 Tax=Shinella zoogloeoides TaxID=352475 RepID=UPI00273F7E88|nr:hypothetical protein [Shinella zoogloeoides]WLR94216.1 hypothetical protein Q9316_08620 [Shinella zoogloeoides]